MAGSYADRRTAPLSGRNDPMQLGRSKERPPLAFEESALFDKRDQLEKLDGALLPTEEVLACLDMKGGGTGFLGITDRRLVIYDKAFLGKMKVITSLPFREIVTI